MWLYLFRSEGVYVFGYQASNGRLQYPAEYSFDVPSIDALIESEYNSKDGVFRLKTIVNSQQERHTTILLNTLPINLITVRFTKVICKAPCTIPIIFHIPRKLPARHRRRGYKPSSVVNVEAGGKHTIHGNYIARNDYMFDGWYDSSDPEITYIPGQIIRVTKPLTLVAKWVPVAEYTLTFDGNGGTVVLAEGLSDLLPNTGRYKHYKLCIGILLNPPGMTFRGWYCEDTIYNSDYTAQ